MNDSPGYPAEFAAAIASLKTTSVRPEVSVRDIPSPGSVAQFSYALAADVYPMSDREGGPHGTGRFIVLYDPEQLEAWGGVFRVVCFAQAPLEVEIGLDPFLADVTWSWLIDALNGRGAHFSNPSGTATRTLSTGFGELAGGPDGAQIELRASWTPTSYDLTGQLEAWADLLCMLAGLPPTSDAVSLNAKRRERG
ncbi:MAG: hypothetical protein RLZZ600_371 [Actinomycetota bacterium]